MLYRVLLVLLLPGVAGCREAPPVVDAAAPALPEPSSSVSVVPAGTLAPLSPQDPGYTCAERGLPAVDPCPGGGDAKSADTTEPELWGACCASGPIGHTEGSSCFVAAEIAEHCRDKAGEAAVFRRLDEVAKAHGEPCLHPQTFMSRVHICKRRGFNTRKRRLGEE